jgi:hypothetical protein
MVPIISLLLIVGTALIVTRVAAVALEHTGLSRDAARFQARSAFTGVGFTTAEAEHVVAHPVRRRIVMWLMLVGNVGIVSAMAAFLLSAIDLRTAHGAGLLLAVLLGGLAFLCWIGSSGWMDRQICRAIRWALGRWTRLDARGYARLLHLRDEYAIARIRVHDGDWIARKTLGDARLAEEGLLVLGIECPGGHFVGVPPTDVQVRDNDEILVYGLADPVSELHLRTVAAYGDRAHHQAVSARGERLRAERHQAGR